MRNLVRGRSDVVVKTRCETGEGVSGSFASQVHNFFGFLSRKVIEHNHLPAVEYSQRCSLRLWFQRSVFQESNIT